MKKTKLKQSDTREFFITPVLKGSAKFIWSFKQTFAVWCAVNFLFLLIFFYIPHGWKNSLSILWLVAYYVYWCIFLRYVQQHPPYFSLVRIFNGLIPVSKIMFINISIYLLLTVIPFIPLLMGFKDRYLEFFEQYMNILQKYDSLFGKTLFYLFMLSISPYTLSRPYLAWISSVVGKSRSIIDAYKKTKGNYWAFVLFALITSAPFMLSYYIDTLYHTQTIIVVMSVLPIYFNVVFINIYKVFYKRRPKTKALAG